MGRLPQLTLAVALTCGACMRPDVRPYFAEAQFRRLQRGLPTVETPGVVYDQDADGAVVREVLRLPDGTVLRHGAERLSYPGGARRALRHYDRDRPVGEWTAWYPDGALRSTYVHGPEPTKSTFYAPDGAVTAQGLAIDGVRTGTWRFYHPSGALAREGCYVDGREEGEWLTYTADGAVSERRVFRAGERIE